MSVSSLSIRRKSLMWDLKLLGALLVQAEGQSGEQFRAPEGAIMNGVKVGGQWIPEGSNFSILKPQDSDVGEALVNFTNMGTIDPEQFAETSLKVSSQISATLGLVNDGLTFQPPEMPPHPDNIKEDVKEYQEAQNELTNAETSDDVGSKFGKFIKAAAPIATAIAFAVAPEIILPMIAGQSISWGFALGSAALGWAVNMATEKALDMAGVDNKWVRLGASAITGLMAGGALTGLRKNLARKTKVLKCESACELKKFQLRMSDQRAEEIDRAIRGFRHSTIMEGTPEVFDHAQSTAKELNKILDDMSVLASKNKARLLESYSKLDDFHKSIGRNKNQVIVKPPAKLPKPKKIGDFQYTKKTLEGSEDIVFSQGQSEALKLVVGDKATITKEFKKMNELLRKEAPMTSKVTKKVKDLDEAIEKLPFYRWDFTKPGSLSTEPLSRFIYLPPGSKPEFMKNLKVGETFSDKGFATFNKMVDGGNYINDDHGHFFNQLVTGKLSNSPTVKFIVKPSLETNARDLRLPKNKLAPKGVLGMPAENSVVFPRDTKFKIAEIREMDVPQYNPYNPEVAKVGAKLNALYENIWEARYSTPPELSKAFFDLQHLVRNPHIIPRGDSVGFGTKVFDAPALGKQAYIRQIVNELGGAGTIRSNAKLLKQYEKEIESINKEFAKRVDSPTSDFYRQQAIEQTIKKYGGQGKIDVAKKTTEELSERTKNIMKDNPYVKGMERSALLNNPRMSRSNMTIVTLEEVGR